MVMGLCWPLIMPPTPKAVLISLADQSNDQGWCWPSLTGISVRTCFGRTAVIEALKWLEDNGYMTIEKTGGRTNRYAMNLTRLRQRELEPVREADQSGSRTGPAGAREPVRQADEPVRQADPNRKEPSSKRNTSLGASTPKPKAVSMTVADLVADGLSEATAVEWIAHRARKRAVLTVLAWSGIKAEAIKAGWPLEKAILKAITRGWQSFDAEFVKVATSKFERDPSSTVADNPQVAETRARLDAEAKRRVATPAEIAALKAVRTAGVTQ